MSNVRTYTLEEITAAVNRAGDDVLEVTNAPDTGLRDTINLLTNAAITYVESPGSDLDDVAEACYSKPLRVILGWMGVDVDPEEGDGEDEDDE